MRKRNFHSLQHWLSFFRHAQSGLLTTATQALLFVLLGFSVQVQASKDFVHTENLKFKSSGKKVDFFSNLAKQKKLEMGKKWSECSTLGAKNFKAQPKIEGWILISWLRCARMQLDASKETAAIEQALAVADKRKDLFVEGAWTEPLLEEVQKARFAIARFLVKAKSQNAWGYLSSLEAANPKLDKSQRASVFLLMSELSQSKTQLKSALHFAQLSLAEAESTEARERVSSLHFALGLPKPAPGDTRSAEVLSEEEQRFESRFSSSLKSNDLIAFIDDGVAYLNQFPTGKRAKWVNDKILDINSNFWNRLEDPKINTLYEKSLSIMEKSDFTRTAEWARILHRKGDFFGSLKLVEKSLPSMGKSKEGAVLYYVAGRSAQFLGDYKKAIKYFEDYVELHSGADDMVEVLFRLGLSHFRSGNPSTSIAVFEKLLSSKSIDKYELSARYWLVRALQQSQNNRAETEIGLLLEKYPFSYYGLRLRLEKQSQGLEWPTSPKLERELKAEWYLSPSQKRVWDRVQILAKGGWIAEAQSEFSEIPNPQTPELKVLLAERLSMVGIYPPVIKMLQQAGDLDPNLRALDIVSLGLPQVYREAIEEQAKKQNLSPYLVRSLIRQESAFGIKARSSSNALGLMQLIPPTAQEVAQDLGLSNLEVPEDLYVPDVNIRLGTHYIAKMVRKFGGNVPLALAAYNAGPSRVQAFVQARTQMQKQVTSPSSDYNEEIWFDELPWFETSFYVKAILRNVILYKLLDKSKLKTPEERRLAFGPVLWSDLVITQ